MEINSSTRLSCNRGSATLAMSAGFVVFASFAWLTNMAKIATQVKTNGIVFQSDEGFYMSEQIAISTTNCIKRNVSCSPNMNYPNSTSGTIP